MENKIDIGIDPDSKAYGVAVYINRQLTVLKSMPLPEILNYRASLEVKFVNWHIEHVLARNKVFGSQGLINRARSLGRCQQSQHDIEIMIADLYPQDVIYRHNISKEWKDKLGTVIFQEATDWIKKSNKDTRSAAYFGFIGCKESRKRLI